MSVAYHSCLAFEQTKHGRRPYRHRILRGSRVRAQKLLPRNLAGRVGMWSGEGEEHP